LTCRVLVTGKEFLPFCIATNHGKIVERFTTRSVNNVAGRVFGGFTRVTGSPRVPFWLISLFVNPMHTSLSVCFQHLDQIWWKRLEHGVMKMAEDRSSHDTEPKIWRVRGATASSSICRGRHHLVLATTTTATKKAIEWNVWNIVFGLLWVDDRIYNYRPVPINAAVDLLNIRTVRGYSRQ
jgi:hypothetical protein